MLVWFILAFVSLVGADIKSYELDKEWESFKTEFSKVYDNPVEEEFRKLIFTENRYKIAKHHEKYVKGLSSFDMAMNHFGDMLHTEFIATTRCWLSNNNDEQRNSTTTFLEPDNVEVPRSVNWVTKGYVTPVLNQGECGSCWAFSAAGAIEGQHKRKTGELVALSEQNLMDCSSSYGNRGCHGGFPDYAFRYVMDNNGVDTLESYPYETKEGPCRFNPNNTGATDTGYTDLKAGSESELMKAVGMVGPVSAGIDASLDSFKFYSEGIYDDPKCSNKVLTHAILVVGYGKLKGSEFWLIKNSWSEKWGKRGFGRIARNNNNQCGIANAPSYPLV